MMRHFKIVNLNMPMFISNTIVTSKTDMTSSKTLRY